MRPMDTVSAVDLATAQLREAILTGRMRPGEPIKSRELEDQLGISHIPIREAIRKLAIEGLIVTPRRRTPVVADVGIEELTAIYELRRMIELPTARRAAERSGAEDLARVERAFAALERVAEEPDSTEFWDHHRELHWALIAAGANEWTERTLEPLWQASERYVRLFMTRFGSPVDAERMHRLLVEAYAGGDPDELARALDDHFTQTERVVADGYRAALAERNGSP